MNTTPASLLISSLLVCMVSSIQASSDPLQTPIQVCSRNLVRAMGIACSGRGHSTNTKRSGIQVLYEPRVRRGITEECCTNICPLRTLLQYCDTPSQRNGADILSEINNELPMIVVANLERSREVAEAKVAAEESRERSQGTRVNFADRFGQSRRRGSRARASFFYVTPVRSMRG